MTTLQAFILGFVAGFGLVAVIVSWRLSKLTLL